MKTARNIHRTLVWLLPAILAIGLLLAATPAPAGGYYGGYYGGHYGGYYGGYRGGYYRGYRGGHYGGYRGGHYGGYYPAYRYGHRSYPGPSYAYSYTGEPKAQSGSPDRRSYTSPDTTPNALSGSGATAGWSQLAEGRYAQALSMFAQEAQSNPRKGVPKVGYALSAAGSGNLQRGVWAMRRALRIDPDAIHYVTIDESLRPRLEQLVTRYHEYLDQSADDAEAAFILASLHYLLGDAGSARTAIGLAVAGGDRSPSTGNLKRLIEMELVPDAQPTPDVQRERGPEATPSRDGGARAARLY